MNFISSYAFSVFIFQTIFLKHLNNFGLSLFIRYFCIYWPPEVKTEWIFPELEASMEEVLKIVVEGRSCRNTASIKNRQPIGTMYVKAPGDPLLPEYQAIIAEELNVKAVIFTQDVRILAFSLPFLSFIFSSHLPKTPICQ